MLKKVVSLFLVFILSFSMMVYGEEIEDELSFIGNDLDVSSLEDLAGKRLYVYGLLDNQIDEEVGIPMLFFAEEEPLTRLEVVELFYKLCLSEKDKEDSITATECKFTDIPDEYKEAVSYLVSKGIVSGISDKEFGISECSLDSFACMVLRYLGVKDISYSDSVNKIEELGLLKYTALENGFTKGDAYIIFSNLLELEQNGERIIDSLVFENMREEIKIPREINIYVNSYLDFLDKFEVAYFFAPRKIHINILEGCSEIERYLIFDKLLKEDYSWKGLFDEFYNINTVFSYTASGWTITYSEVFKEHWKVSQDERALKSVEMCADIDKLLEQGIFEEYGELNKIYSTYLKDLVKFDLTSDKARISVSTNNYNDSVYLNIDILDWVRCYNKLEFTQSIIDCLADMEEYKDLSDYDKIIKVHDYICRKSSYDYNEYRGLQREDYDYEYADAHEVEGFLIDGNIVCDGYAYVYQWLLDYLDIDCIVIYGDSTLNEKKEGHAWNKVRIEDKWYNVDVCWADTGCGKQYFLKSDEYFEKNYHLQDDDFKIYSLQALENYR